jgi:hypothetical protein
VGDEGDEGNEGDEGDGGVGDDCCNVGDGGDEGDGGAVLKDFDLMLASSLPPGLLLKNAGAT